MNEITKSSCCSKPEDSFTIGDINKMIDSLIKPNANPARSSGGWNSGLLKLKELINDPAH